MEQQFAKITNLYWTYSTHPDAKLYGCRNYDYDNEPELHGVYLIIKAIVINGNEPGYIVRHPETTKEYILAYGGVEVLKDHVYDGNVISDLVIDSTDIPRVGDTPKEAFPQKLYRLCGDSVYQYHLIQVLSPKNAVYTTKGGHGVSNVTVKMLTDNNDVWFADQKKAYETIINRLEKRLQTLKNNYQKL